MSKFWVFARTGIEENFCNGDTFSGDNQGFHHFGGISSHLLFWLWDKT
ncbi:unnamed protein product [Staurois parvus]|uniref:Uncharacterized protein n=1 Tax=Staurois parvus TaxID=386267 RepID=A0ABN9CJC6_9NEOB|nr:unnamed protein product [Staurois parvus]